MDLQMVPGRHIFGAFEIPSWCQSTPRRSEKGTIWHNSAVHDHRGTDAPSPMSWKKKKWQKSQLPLGLPEKSEDTTLENGFPTKMLLQEPNKKKNGKLQPHK
jgi:hypothetical protein